MHAGKIIGWTLLSAIVPGAAHLRAGRTRVGALLVGGFVTAILVLALVGFSADATLAAKFLNAGWLNTVIAAAVVVGLAWFALIVRSYMVLRPGSLSYSGQLVSGSVTGVLAVAMFAPFAFAAGSIAISQSAIGSVFKDHTGAPINAADPWRGRERVNILLLGGDWAASRGHVGVRTDSMNVASIDVRTGNTVLLGLPRALENAPFPAGSPLAKRFPPPKGFYLPYGQGRGSADLLNSVWYYADSHPEHHTRGHAALEGSIEQILGLKIDYYVLVNMWGLARLVDALGGVTLTVEKDIYYGVGRRDGGVVKAGTRRLNGNDALWYGRSRTYSSDDVRMGRQRCLMNALLKQADPATVLAKFNSVAQAAKGTFHTNIPRDLLEHLVPLAAKAKGAKVTSVQFVQPLINPAYPDWAKMRKVTAKAIADSAKPVEPSATPTATPTRTSKPKETGKAKRLDQLCA